MASIQLKNETYYCQFVYLGKRHTVTVGKVTPAEADAFAGNAEHLLFQLKRSYASLPEGAHVTEFLLHNGRIPEKAQAPPTAAKMTFGQVCDKYLEIHGNGAMESNSLETVKIHLRHLERTLGAKFAVGNLAQADLQRHITRRGKAKGIRGKKLSPTTLRKEIASFRAVWNWAIHGELVSKPFPNHGLVFPKTDEKPSFRTRAEIDREILRSRLRESEIADLWDCLFLARPEIDQLLEHVRAEATQPFLYPMVCMAAHTGARRSELLRCRVIDIDFEAGSIVIREKKRSHESRTTRRVPLSQFLANVLKTWINGDHPGGPLIFMQDADIPRSRSKQNVATPVTRNESHDHLRRCLAASKWDVLRGWHVLRHSFISNCVATGIDQRMLDQWVGHTTEIRRRYQHLIPSNERTAIDLVFGCR